MAPGPVPERPFGPLYPPHRGGGNSPLAAIARLAWNRASPKAPSAVSQDEMTAIAKGLGHRPRSPRHGLAVGGLELVHAEDLRPGQDCEHANRKRNVIDRDPDPGLIALHKSGPAILPL